MVALSAGNRGLQQLAAGTRFTYAQAGESTGCDAPFDRMNEALCTIESTLCTSGT
jgi:hypothetical protein